MPIVKVLVFSSVEEKILEHTNFLKVPYAGTIVRSYTLKYQSCLRLFREASINRKCLFFLEGGGRLLERGYLCFTAAVTCLVNLIVLRSSKMNCQDQTDDLKAAF